MTTGPGGREVYDERDDEGDEPYDPFDPYERPDDGWGWGS